MGKLVQWICDGCKERACPSPEGTDPPKEWVRVEYHFKVGNSPQRSKLLCPVCTAIVWQALTHIKDVSLQEEADHATT